MGLKEGQQISVFDNFGRFEDTCQSGIWQLAEIVKAELVPGGYIGDVMWLFRASAPLLSILGCNALWQV